MSDDDQRILQIARRAIDQTNKGIIEWRPLERRQNAYYTWLGGESIMTVTSVDDDGVAPYEFFVGNRAMPRAASISSSVGGNAGEVNGVLRQVFSAAERQVRGLDTVLESLERNLGIDSDDS